MVALSYSLLTELCYAHTTVFLVSMPHLAMRLKSDVPSGAEVVTCLTGMLSSWDYRRAHFVGHSFGSVVMAWVVRQAPEIVSSAVFIDPVCFLLAKPDVCYNFVYRPPQKPLELVMSYFAARELFIANSLSRNFFWFDCILWPESLAAIPSLIVLSGRDNIVPAHSVCRYLTAYKHQYKTNNIHISWLPDLGHGEFLLFAHDAVIRDMFALNFATEALPAVVASDGGRDALTTASREL